MNHLDKVQLILDETCEYFGILPEQVFSKTRKTEVIRAKHVSMFLIRKLLKITLKEIGRIFDADHSTVIHAISNVQETLPSALDQAEILRAHLMPKLTPHKYIVSRENPAAAIEFIYGENQDCCGIYKMSIS